MVVARTNTIQILYSTGTDDPSTAGLTLGKGELAWADHGSGGGNGRLYIGDGASGAQKWIAGIGTGVAAAAAGSLTGATLAGDVLASSLTSLGTIASLVATTADINNGTVDAVIGATSAKAGTFTTLACADITSTGDDHSFTNATASKPAIAITNTADDATGPILKFASDNRTTAAAGDDAGTIQFFADNSSNEQIQYAAIKAEIGTGGHTNTDEAGKLSLFVAESDGSNSALTAGLILEGEATTDGQIDVTIGAGADSMTTVVGNLSVNGTTTQLDSTTTLVKDKEIYLGVAGGMVEATWTRSTTTMTITSDSHGLANPNKVLIAGSGTAAAVDAIYTVAAASGSGSTKIFSIACVNTGAASGTLFHSVTPLTTTTASGSGIFVPGDDMKSIKWDSTNEWVFSDNIYGTGATLTGITMDSSTVTGIDEGTAFTDADDHLMTSGAIKEKIENYSYLTADVAVSDGGTGSSTADGALGNLGGTTFGKEVFKLADVDAIRFLRMDADNGVTALSAANMLTAIGGGTSSSDNVSTTLAQGTTSTTVYNITSDGGTDDLAIPTATTLQAGVMSSAQFDAHVLNNAKVTANSATTFLTNAAADIMAVSDFAGVAALKIDADQPATAAAEDSKGLWIDYDRIVAGSGTANHNDIGIDLDVNAATLGTGTVTGIDIDVVGAATGTHTAIGIDMDVDTAGTANIGMQINTAGTHIKLIANADTSDYATIVLADTGDLTITTVGSGTTDSDLTLAIDGELIVTSAIATGIDIASGGIITNATLAGGTF